MVRREYSMTRTQSTHRASSRRLRNPAFASPRRNRCNHNFPDRIDLNMSIATTDAGTFQLWSEEPATRADRRKIRARIGGLHCSLCTGTIEKALGRLAGVDKVAVSLTHEQALVEYDPAVARPEQLLQTLRDIGYTISDPRKLRAFEDEERDLVREARRFVVAVALSVAAIPIIADPAVGWIGFLPALGCLSLGVFAFLVLRSSGLWAAVGASVGLTVMALSLLYLYLL